jgi:hypothetical protein
MSVVWLSWYISGMMTLLFVVSSLISYAPEAQRAGVIIQAGCAGGALCWAALAMWLGRYPHDHWVHRSKSLWASFAAVAILVTVMLVLVG